MVTFVMAVTAPSAGIVEETAKARQVMISRGANIRTLSDNSNHLVACLMRFAITCNLEVAGYE